MLLYPAPSASIQPSTRSVTSQHAYNSVVQTHSQCLGTREATGPTRQVLDGDTEAATSLSHQQVLAGPRKGKDQPIKRHIVGSTGRLAPSTALMTCAVPALALAYTVGKRQDRAINNSPDIPCLCVKNSGGSPGSRPLCMCCSIHYFNPSHSEKRHDTWGVRDHKVIW